MKIFLTIETADVEIVGVRAHRTRKAADKTFNAIQRENSLHDADDLSHEVAGTLRMAGDDSCAVQLIEAKL